MSTYYLDQLEILWEQVVGQRDIMVPTIIGITHSENFIWSSDYVVRDQELFAGKVTNLNLNWADQFVVDSTAWDGAKIEASWISPVVSLGEGWKPDYITTKYDDREDYKYVSTKRYYRGSNTAPVTNENDGGWLNGEHPKLDDPFSLLEWVEVIDSVPIDAQIKYVQVKIEFTTTDPAFRFPIFKTVYLAKRWWEDAVWSVPSDTQKYDIGLFEDSEETDFYGIKLSPAIDSTSPMDGLWISPVHDFGASMHPRWASWYAMIPAGASMSIKVRGSDTAPIGEWTQDNLPDDNDPIWGINGSLENSWYNISIEQMITDVIGVVRYAQFKIDFGVIE